MLADGLRPDRPTYSRLISVCAYAEGLRGEAEGLWVALVEEGHEVDTFMYLHLATALGSGACRCGSAGRGMVACETRKAALPPLLMLPSALPPSSPPCVAGPEGPSRWPVLLRVLHAMQMGLPNYKDTHVQASAACCWVAGRHVMTAWWATPGPLTCALRSPLPRRSLSRPLLQTVAVSLAAKHSRLDLALAVYRLMLQDGVQPKSPTFNACACCSERA